MFYIRERHETDDFAIQKNILVVKEKYMVEISIFQEITRFCVRKYLCIFLRFRTFRAFFIFFPYKNLNFLRGQGSPRPFNGDVSFF